MEFQYHLPVNLVFGRGKADQIGKLSAPYGTRALIVTGGSSTKRSGLLDKTVGLLEACGISSVVFDRVTPNPLTETVYEGAALAKAEDCDFIVGIGGGSSLDAAKGIAFQVVNGGDISEYIFGLKVSDKALPIVAVPTTCGTGSEGNGYAVLTNPQTLDKKSLRTVCIVPSCSIIDPLLMTTMPKRVLASVGFDALCHNMEAYLSGAGNALTKVQALEGVSLTAQGLRRAYRDAGDLEGWDMLSLGSTLGGMTIGAASVTAPHALEHPASGLRNIVHGDGLAALTCPIIRHTLPAAEAQYLELARRIGGPSATDIVAELESLLTELNLRVRLRDFGITEADIPWMAENCVKIFLGGLKAHPKFFEPAELMEIYAEAL
ncbi:1,3-propanediol dehydrogenase [bioreactor metagenome]|uniref:1,3-propanediol dehydrogenase n=1 Tax=bioreactor metagenome TaxID=1076179 RepID=A0A645BCT3_9ZZZZ